MGNPGSLQKNFQRPLGQRGAFARDTGTPQTLPVGGSNRAAFRTRSHQPSTLIYNGKRRTPMKNLYVGNLPHSTTEPELRGLFEAHGAVERVSIVTDRETGRARGFGFVEMTNAAEADKAVAALNGTELGGRALKINEAKPKTDAPRGGEVLRRDKRNGRKLLQLAAEEWSHKRFLPPAVTE